MAGGLLARQLVRAVPGVRVGLFERDTRTSYKVGESTVEIASHYLIRRLGLSRYLYEQHLPKNGLRYFFDGPERDAALEELSEIGTVNLPFHPAFQVDRARLDADLLEMDRRDGVHVETGACVVDMELGEGQRPHRFAVEKGGRRKAWEARWLVDASGRNALLARLLGLRVREDGHPIRAVWGRFENVVDIDDRRDDAFASRVRHTSRGLSTIHFCYPGYWIWFIPLRFGLTSVGFVGHPPVDPASMRTVEGFRAFLESHRAVAELLAGAKAVDVAHYKNLSYGTRHVFGKARWALVGEAASFADPLYSPGADFIALENDFLTDLVRRDLGGAPGSELGARVDLYDRFMGFRHEAAMRLYRGLYGLLGSYEAMRLKWDFDVGCYYNLWVAPYMRDDYLDEAFLRRQLRQQRPVLQALANFAGLLQTVEGRLRERGAYFRANVGRFSHGLEHIDFVEEIGLPRGFRRVHEVTASLFNGIRARAHALAEPDAPEPQPLPLSSFMVQRPLL
jgi:flavin-dependent dehydrogenase